MKKYLLAFIATLDLAACVNKDEVNFKLPAIPYATAGGAGVTDNGEPAVKKKEFAFPSVPYAQ
jgi:hypothetical protein